MIEEREPIPLVAYVCARANLSNAVQQTAINTFMTKQAHLLAVARFEDEFPHRRSQLFVAIKRMREGNCRGMIVFGVPILIEKMSNRQSAEILANFIGPQGLLLYDVNGLVCADTLLSMRNNAIAQIHQDVD
ncbi:MAG TPA: hypothetical protein V6D22_26130 [Candidatus Obscuribacterales bacterium]